MKKKTAFCFFISVLMFFLFVNLSFGKINDLIFVNFENIEALAENENGFQGDEMCVKVGTICVGVNIKGEFGVFPGLSDIGDME